MNRNSDQFQTTPDTMPSRKQQRRFQDKIMAVGADKVLTSFERCGVCKKALCWTADAQEELRKMLTNDPDYCGKLPNYVAFSGSSGSGKTTSMLHLVDGIARSDLPAGCKHCWKLYLTWCGGHDTRLYDFVERKIRFSGEVEDNNWYSYEPSSAVLVLILDELPNKFSHKDYFRLPGWIKSKFGFMRVVLLVGSTALNRNVIKQPTGNEVVNIRMKSMKKSTIMKLMEYHLEIKAECGIEDLQIRTLARQFVDEMPALIDLMGNHRCAYLTVQSIRNLYGFDFWKMNVPKGWCENNSPTILSMVAAGYRSMNGLAHEPLAQCEELMLQSMALVAVQTYINDNQPLNINHKLEEQARHLVEIGLIEWPIDFGKSTSCELYADGHYEYTMTPAITLLCVQFLFPSIGGIHNASDRFEALVAVFMASIRYAQTNKKYKIERMKEAIPYNGKEDHFYWMPSKPSAESVFMNGPQAPYGNVIVAGVPPITSESIRDEFVKTLSALPGAEYFPTDPVVIQCKFTSTPEAYFDFAEDLAKMGLDGDGKKCLKNPYGGKKDKDNKMSQQLRSAQWLTEKWVMGNDYTDFSALIVCNNKFKCDGRMPEVRLIEPGIEETPREYFGWHGLYPIDQIIHQSKGDAERTMGVYDASELQELQKKRKKRHIIQNPETAQAAVEQNASWSGWLMGRSSPRNDNL